ncbi:patatin-like phospholipase family protein [Streptomyces lydicus]|uniref:patatin-like phospholipase family protein n=1 Tax=Streptomyces lydicus TaxID=47763 RepID=UPI001FCB5999|nr:patatin-like phospholipase family protein [Streptomyces lydicus]
MDRDVDLGRGLVLGPGGIIGTAWTAGLAHGLRHEGVDLGEAELTVGTSAGAIVAAALSSGQDLERFAAPAPVAGPRPRTDARLMGEVFAVLGNPGLEPAEARRRVGRIALDHADPEAEQALLAVRRALIGTDTWPDRRLLITAVDAATGEPVVWDRSSGVPLTQAVAASSAFPGAAPPVTVQGRRYMDGALRSGTNADLARGCRALLVVDPMAHLHPQEPRDTEPLGTEPRGTDPRGTEQVGAEPVGAEPVGAEPVGAELPVAGTDSVVTVVPDPASVRAFGADLNDPAAREPAFRAGLHQAAAVVAQLRPWAAAKSGAAPRPTRP